MFSFLRFTLLSEALFSPYVGIKALYLYIVKLNWWKSDILPSLKGIDQTWLDYVLPVRQQIQIVNLCIQVMKIIFWRIQRFRFNTNLLQPETHTVTSMKLSLTYRFFSVCILTAAWSQAALIRPACFHATKVSSLQVEESLFVPLAVYWDIQTVIPELRSLSGDNCGTGCDISEVEPWQRYAWAQNIWQFIGGSKNSGS